MSSKELAQRFEKSIQQMIDRHPTLTQRDKLMMLEKNLKYNRAWILCALIAIIVMILFILGGLKLVSRLLGFIYPAYSSMKAIEFPKEKDSELWLCYWIIVGFSGVFEPLARPIIDIVPFYPIIKTAFLVWCYNPSTKGAKRVHSDVIRPFINPLLGISSVPIQRTESKSESKNRSIDSELEVEVEVKSASNLPSMEDDQTDPYALAYIQTKKGNIISDKCKTRVKTGRKNPEWNEKINLKFNKADFKSDAELVVYVCHKTSLGEDMKIGKVVTPLTRILNVANEAVCPLTDPDRENPIGVAGFIRLSMCFNAGASK